MKSDKKIYLLIISLLIGVAYASQEADPLPPINPNYYSMSWNIYLIGENVSVPIDPSRDPILRKGTGKTFYNWEHRQMLEVYETFCIPIFELPTTDFNFRCKFLNTNETVYLLVQGSETRPPCCIFSQNFHPPLPTFARDNKLVYNGTYSLEQGEYDAYWLNIPLPGPFLYGWYKNATDGVRAPSLFAFPTVPPQVWTQQDFFDFKVERPDPSVFEVPDYCADAKPCVWAEGGDDILSKNSKSFLEK